MDMNTDPLAETEALLARIEAQAAALSAEIAAESAATERFLAAWEKALERLEEAVFDQITVLAQLRGTPNMMELYGPLRDAVDAVLDHRPSPLRAHFDCRADVDPADY
jgi:hypothetical protein